MTKQVVALDEVLRLLDSVGAAFQNIARLVHAAEFGEATTSIEDFIPIQSGESKKRTRRTKAEIEAEKAQGGIIVDHMPELPQPTFAPVAAPVAAPSLANLTPIPEIAYTILDAQTVPVIIDSPVRAPEVVVAPVVDVDPFAVAAPRFDIRADHNNVGVAEVAKSMASAVSMLAPDFLAKIAVPLMNIKGAGHPVALNGIIANGKVVEYLTALENAVKLIEAGQPITDLNTL